MYFRKAYFVGVVLCGWAVLSGFQSCNRLHRGAIIEQWHNDNKRFQVRITAYQEKGANVNGAYYV
jgi:hypothetical protein